MAEFLPIHSGLIESFEVFYNLVESSKKTICVIETDNIPYFIIVDDLLFTRRYRRKVDIRKTIYSHLENLLGIEVDHKNFDIINIWGFSCLDDPENTTDYIIILHIINKETNKNFVVQVNMSGYSVPDDIYSISVYDFMFNSDNIPIGIVDRNFKIVSNLGTQNIRNLGFLYVDVKRKVNQNNLAGNKLRQKRFAIDNEDIQEALDLGVIDEEYDTKYPFIQTWELPEVILEIPDDTEKLNMDFSTGVIVIE